MKDLLSIFFKDNSGAMMAGAPVRWLPVEYHDTGLPDGRPITVRFQAFEERALARSHPRHLDNYGDVSMTLDAVAAVAAGTPAPAHAEVPAEVAHAALQAVLARSRDTAPRFMAAHALGDDASRTAFLRDCTARGILLRDPGPRVEAALVV